MDPTQRKQPKPTSYSDHHHLRHPQPDPTIIPPSTIQNISHRFSKLYYANHKTNPLKPPPSNSQPPLLHPEPETDFHPPVSDTSCTTLTKSSSQHDRNNICIGNNINSLLEKEHDSRSKTKLREKDEIKKPSKSNNKDTRKQSFHDCDVNKASQLMSKSLESDKVKRWRQGIIIESRRPSVSSIPPQVVSGGRRKSFCSSQVELADFFACTGVKVMAVDMPPFKQIHAVNCARKSHDSLEKFTSKTLALTLKKEFDGVYGPAWHCIVGTSFGSFVTHSVGGFMYFSMDHKLYILLFKTTLQRAD